MTLSLSHDNKNDLKNNNSSNKDNNDNVLPPTNFQLNNERVSHRFLARNTFVKHDSITI